MYKCKNCGNTEKFFGIVSEKGNAFICQNESDDKKPLNYSWIYCMSDNCWSSNMKIRRCYYCNSRKIVKV
jgi:hypothetical protein